MKQSVTSQPPRGWRLSPTLEFFYIVILLVFFDDKYEIMYATILYYKWLGQIVPLIVAIDRAVYVSARTWHLV